MEGKPVIEMGGVGQASAEAVKRLDQHDVVAAKRQVGDEFLVAWPVDARA
nr:hypothetical protein [Rhodovibrio salinarum]